MSTDTRNKIPKLRNLLYSNDPDEITLSLISSQLAYMSKDCAELEICDNKSALKSLKKDCAALMGLVRLFERKVKEEVQSEVLGPNTVKDKGEARGRVENIIEYNEKRAAEKRAEIEENKSNQ